MYIYCGNSEHGKVRVLDTSDMITEEIDLLQLKALQSQGYSIIKDFSYDYAHKFMQFGRNRINTSYSALNRDMEDGKGGIIKESLIYLRKLDKLVGHYNIESVLNMNKISFESFCAFDKMTGFIAIFLDDKTLPGRWVIRVVTANESGVFYDSDVVYGRNAKSQVLCIGSRSPYFSFDGYDETKQLFVYRVSDRGKIVKVR